MTTSRFRASRSKPLLAAVFALPLLLGSCAQDAEPAAAGSDSKPAAPAGTSKPAVQSDCPTQLRPGDLGGGAMDLGTADIDGDGAEDTVTVGVVPDGGRACAVAVMVATASGDISVAPIPGAATVPVQAALDMPVFAPVDDAPGDEIMMTTMWSPRGGGLMGMFSWVDGQLVQVTKGARPFEMFATVDDGGGSPQLLTCVPGGFLHVTESGPAANMTAYSIREGVVTKLTGQAAEDLYPPIRDTYPGMPDRGLVAFPDCG